MARALIATIATCLTLSVAGCGPKTKQAEPAPQPTVTTAPKVGECHNLSFKQVLANSDTTAPVSCSSRHTTIVAAVVDAPKGMATAPDLKKAEIAGETCGDGFKKIVGGDSKTRAKTLYSLAWFFPTKAQRAKGAKWVRCDVTLSDQQHVYVIKGRTALLSDGPTDAELRCGRAKKGKAAWEFVPCAVKHDFVPSKLIAVEPKTTYKGAEKGAAKACGLRGDLYSWSVPEQWGMGDRWYTCWITTREDDQGSISA